MIDGIATLINGIISATMISGVEITTMISGVEIATMISGVEIATMINGISIPTYCWRMQSCWMIFGTSMISICGKIVGGPVWDASILEAVVVLHEEASVYLVIEDRIDLSMR